jgi:hypothetical protein
VHPNDGVEELVSKHDDEGLMLTRNVSPASYRTLVITRAELGTCFWASRDLTTCHLRRPTTSQTAGTDFACLIDRIVHEGSGGFSLIPRSRVIYILDLGAAASVFKRRENSKWMKNLRSCCGVRNQMEYNPIVAHNLHLDVDIASWLRGTQGLVLE